MTPGRKESDSPRIETRSVAGTEKFARRFAERLAVGDCVALIGELGAGKTAFVRGLAAGLGVDDERLVSSPTYVLAQEYPGRTKLYHLDLYRMVDADAELPDLGFDEMLTDGVAVIEWADRADRALPRPRWQITLDITGPRARRLTVQRVE